MNQKFMYVEQLAGLIVVLLGSENPHDVIQHERDSSKANGLCALMKNKTIGP
jgi:hypothetical protein